MAVQPVILDLTARAPKMWGGIVSTIVLAVGTAGRVSLPTWARSARVCIGASSDGVLWHGSPVTIDPIATGMEAINLPSGFPMIIPIECDPQGAETYWTIANASQGVPLYMSIEWFQEPMRSAP